MTDERQGQAGRPTVPWRVRLVDRFPLLVAVAAVLVVLAAMGQLSLPFAILGYAAIVVAAALVPGGEAAPIAVRGAATGEAIDDDTMHRFAEALPDPCLILDGRSILLQRNSAAAQQFPGLAVGSPIALSLRAPAVLTAIDAVRASGKPETVELHQTVPTETWHRVTIAPLAPDDGRLVVTMQSLTEAKRLDALRTDFIANASHELRTPLTSLLGFIDTLTGPAAKDPAAQARFLDIMRTQAARMSSLIDDLLSLSRIEMRQHVRPTGSVDLGLLLREIREGLLTQAEEAGAAVNLDLPADPAVVTGDREELYEAFQNVIDNALKYGASGGKVDVALKPVTDRPGYAWRVEVTDYGAGIPSEHVPRLTERFYRVDAESSRKKKGTGLGLAIVKHIVTRHRGSLSIRSRPGEGTRVEVTLPG